MLITMRIIGVWLALIGLANLIGMFFIDLSSLLSPVSVIVRCSLSLVAGIGFILLLKWGVLVFFVSVLINWISYFTIYGGQGAVTTLWAAVPIPLIIGIISYRAWGRLDWRIRFGPKHQTALKTGR